MKPINVFFVVIFALAADARKVRYRSQFFVQLTNATFETLARAPQTILVVDPDDARLTAEENGILNSQGKNVFAYVSVGQAENFRSYWSSEWTTNSSSIYVKADPEYVFGMVVKYWEPEWKNALLEYLGDNVFPYNYSGIMLDYLQNYDQFTDVRPNAMQDMIDLSKAVVDETRRINPEAIIIAQDSPSLWDLSDEYKQMVDILSVQEVWFDANGKSKSANWTQSQLDILRRASNAKKVVMLEEYVEKNSQVCMFYKKCTLEGFLCAVLDGLLTGIHRDCIV